MIPAVARPAAALRRAGRADGRSPSWARRRTRLVAGVVVAVAYLGVSVAVWWQVWSRHPTSTMTCGCGDPSLLLWSFGWVAHAIAHGQNPFFSTAVFHPDGMNLLVNVSALLEGTLLAPVTWAFGPVATLNVANTLAPAVSAMATYWAVRRCLRSGRLGALVAGLVVELSPALVGSGAASHLQTSLLAFVPVVAVCLYELLVRQAGTPWRWGVALALAVVGQFFASTELLAILAVVVVVVLVAVAAGLAVAAARGSRSAVRRAAHAARGLALAGVIAAAALAYPLWFALAGPRHVTGAPWPDLVGASGTVLGGTVSASHPPGLSDLYQLAGYFGPPGAPVNYLGAGAVVVACLAVVVLWRRAAVWVLTAVGAASGWLALGAVWQPIGAHRPWWVPFLPWSWMVHLPLAESILPQNFAVLTVLAVAALVGMLVDRVWRLARGRLRVATGAAALAVAAAALVPLATAWSLPLTAQPVGVPAWFSDVAPGLPAGSVVLTYPFAGPPGDSAAMVWQAVGGMHVAIAGGCCIVPGPDGHADHGTAPGSAHAVLGALSMRLSGPLPALDDTIAQAAVRDALVRWGVTTVVVVDRGRDPAYATRWFTALLGRPPADQHGAHVWTIDAAALASRRA